MELIRTLASVRNTLDSIEVKGKGNLDMLLGCIQTLENTIVELQKTERKTEAEVNDG